jgi:hypothetical protein
VAEIPERTRPFAKAFIDGSSTALNDGGDPSQGRHLLCNVTETELLTRIRTKRCQPRSGMRDSFQFDPLSVFFFLLYLFFNFPPLPPSPRESKSKSNRIHHSSVPAVSPFSFVALEDHFTYLQIQIPLPIYKHLLSIPFLPLSSSNRRNRYAAVQSSSRIRAFSLSLISLLRFPPKP